MLRETPGIPEQPPSPTPFSGTIAALEPQDEPICRRCTASSSNRSPSVGLAVVDSMAGCQIKALASHAQAFRERSRASPRVSADNPAAGRAGGSPQPPPDAGALPVSYEPRSGGAPRP